MLMQMAREPGIPEPDRSRLRSELNALHLDIARGERGDVVGGHPGSDDLPLAVVGCLHAPSERIEAAVVHIAVRGAADSEKQVSLINVTLISLVLCLSLCPL